jgi:hypothetical protein
MNEEQEYKLMKHKIWAATIIVSILLFVILIVFLNTHPYQMIFSFNMDNNTLEAVKALNATGLPR